jgi:Na+-transporting NADH:ubiquinone oxidoreductase subunit NqrB
MPFWVFIPGSVGETSALLILLAAAYLIITKSAKWQPMLATTLGLLIFVTCSTQYHQNPLFFLV